MHALFLLATFPAPAGTPAGPVALSGAVQTEAGQPLRGASVFVRYAGPRQGVGHL